MSPFDELMLKKYKAFFNRIKEVGRDQAYLELVKPLPIEERRAILRIYQGRVLYWTDYYGPIELAGDIYFDDEQYE